MRMLTIALGLLAAPVHAEAPPTALQTGTRHRVIVADSSTKTLASIAADGRVEWRLPVGAIHDLHLLPDGHILYQDGWTRIVELDAHRRPIWEFDVPLFGKPRKGGHGPEAFGDQVCSAVRLATGNTRFVNCHAGPENPQIIEVTPEKQVVWTFKDFTTFGNSLPVAVVR